MNRQSIDQIGGACFSYHIKNSESPDNARSIEPSIRRCVQPSIRLDGNDWRCAIAALSDCEEDGGRMKFSRFIASHVLNRLSFWMTLAIVLLLAFLGRGNIVTSHEERVARSAVTM
jgi:hypothetical protein